MAKEYNEVLTKEELNDCSHDALQSLQLTATTGFNRGHRLTA
jgi:hypothetical protein